VRRERERERERALSTYTSRWRVVASCSRARYGSKVGGYLPFAALIYRISRRTNTHSAKNMWLVLLRTRLVPLLFLYSRIAVSGVEANRSDHWTGSMSELQMHLGLACVFIPF